MADLATALIQLQKIEEGCCQAGTPWRLPSSFATPRTPTASASSTHNSTPGASIRPYEDFDLSRRIDAVAISGEVGLRKPKPAIYGLAAERLGLPPSACVFVDDVEQNLPAVRALGMAIIHHVGNVGTLHQLAQLLRIPLGHRVEPSSG